MAKLDVRAEGSCRHDFLSLGSLVQRFDPGLVPLHEASRFDRYCSGAEYNPAANIAKCFHMRAAIASAMVQYPPGWWIEAEVRKAGVTGIYKWFAYDGVRGPRMANTWSDRGIGVRAPEVWYDRANEAGALLAPGDFDWHSLFKEGVRWFHSGGIFASLSPSTSALILEAMTAARAAGTVVSYDLNFRKKLWDASQGGSARALEVNRAIAAHTDVLIGNEEDLQLGLGIAGPQVTTGACSPRHPQLSRDDRAGSRGVPESQGNRDDAARGPLRVAPCLEGASLVRGDLPRDPRDGARRSRPDRRGRRVCRGARLWIPPRGVTRDGAETWMGARSPSHDVSR